MSAAIHHGDCLEVLRGMADASVDAVVTDPPYGLSFMGKKWDYDVPSEDIWRECLRVLKPGGHLLAFAGTRTQHRMAVNIEDGGFEIRDMIAWVYGSGFPKSLDVSKAIDRAAGATREAGVPGPHYDKRGSGSGSPCFGDGIRDKSTALLTTPATDAARQWQGWGTALKPALEPITVARKAPIGTVAENVLLHGTGAINVDGCRIESPVDVYSTAGCGLPDGANNKSLIYQGGYKGEYVGAKIPHPQSPRHHAQGRWPANLIHDGSDEVVGLFPQTTSGVLKAGTKRTTDGGYHGGFPQIATHYDTGGDSGSAARFFYCAKASKADRDEGCEALAAKLNADWPQNLDGNDARGAAPRRNHHPTVKPTALMRYLCRLVTPPSGIVLDPFMGSGSTGKAAILEGFQFIGIEREAEYVAIAKARIAKAEAERGEMLPLEEVAA